MDRDVNGARGIFLRALGDSPFLRGLLTQVASHNRRSVECCLAFIYRNVEETLGVRTVMPPG